MNLTLANAAMPYARVHTLLHFRQVSHNDALLSSEARRLIMDSSAREKNAFTAWKFRHYFVSKEVRGNNITVQCKLCLPAVHTLSSSKDSTSNLKKHLMVSETANVS